MKHIKLFNTDAQYQEFASDIEQPIPNVSYVTETDLVHYNEVAPDPTNGFDYVEIGGLKWATMNVGASEISDEGYLFRFGETQPYDNNTSGEYEVPSEYKLENDAAHVYMGGKWRMPTLSEILALLGNTTPDREESPYGYITYTSKADPNKKLLFKVENETVAIPSSTIGQDDVDNTGPIVVYDDLLDGYIKWYSALDQAFPIRAVCA